MRNLEEVKGDYAYNLVADLVDYCGDIKKSGGNKSSIAYSKDYSPNNIRRLIIGGDGVCIYFHKPINGKYFKIRAFSDSDQCNINKCLYLPDYKPMIWALSERICSSVEEIIICTQSKSGINFSRELNLDGLLRNYNSRNGDVKESVMRRYTRLAYFTIIDCMINDLVVTCNKLDCNNPHTLISELPTISNRISSAIKFKDDWYKYYSIRPQYYSFDTKLADYFSEVIASIEKESKKNEVEKIKNERLKGVKDSFDKEFKNFNGVFTCIHTLHTILNQEGTNYISSDISSLSVDINKKPSDIKEEFDKITSNDKCTEYIKYVKSSSSKLYFSLVNWLLDNMLKVKQNYPITLGVFLDEVDRCIYVPDLCKSKLDALGVDFTGSNMLDSTANICAYACTLFVTDVGQHSMSKYYKKDTWVGIYKRGVA